MNRIVPVRDVGHLRLALPANDRWVGEVGWIPVSATEIHLACRYYPIAIRFDGPKPVLGLILDQRYLTQPLLDSAGGWRGAYRPMGLRCFPFSASATITDDPLTDIAVDADSKYLSVTDGISIVDDAGKPGRLLNDLHRLFHLLQYAREVLAVVLDQYLIGNVLLPINDADTDRPLYVLDPVRFLHLQPAALGAMARHNFLSVDLAVACFFSLQNMRANYRPKGAEKSQHPFAAAAIVPDISIGELPLALDDGDLISPCDIVALRAEARV